MNSKLCKICEDPACEQPNAHDADEGKNYVFVDVEDKRHCVNVYDHNGEINSREFVSSRDQAMNNARTAKVVDDPYAAACAYAKKEAARVGCDWGAND